MVISHTKLFHPNNSRELAVPSANPMSSNSCHSSIHSQFQKIIFNACYFYFLKLCIKTQEENDQWFLLELLRFNSGSVWFAGGSCAWLCSLSVISIYILTFSTDRKHTNIYTQYICSHMVVLQSRNSLLVFSVNCMLWFIKEHCIAVLSKSLNWFSTR